jgi:hypothetical protein
MQTRWKPRVTTIAASVLLILIMSLPASSGRPRKEPAGGNTEQKLKAMLTEFLNAANTGDKAVFKRFFAEDAIYTSSKAVVLHKADIMKSLDEPAPPGAAKTTYGHTDAVVRSFGDNLAIVNFQLNRYTVKDNQTQECHFRNTGTFLRRNKQWQAIAWQSTLIPEMPDARLAPNRYVHDRS